MLVKSSEAIDTTPQRKGGLQSITDTSNEDSDGQPEGKGAKFGHC